MVDLTLVEATIAHIDRVRSINLRNGQGSQDPWPSVFLGSAVSGHESNAERFGACGTYRLSDSASMPEGAF